jgi:uncharacterized protein (DUF1919 family)
MKVVIPKSVWVACIVNPSNKKNPSFGVLSTLQYYFEQELKISFEVELVKIYINGKTLEDIDKKFYDLLSELFKESDEFWQIPHSELTFFQLSKTIELLIEKSKDTEFEV